MNHEMLTHIYKMEKKKEKEKKKKKTNMSHV